MQSVTSHGFASKRSIGGLNMPIDQTDSIIRRISEEITTKGDLSVIDGVYDARLINHAANPGASTGLQGMQERHNALRAAFPDWQETIERISARGDKIVVRSIVRGTHKGSWMGIAPTGKRIRAMRITILRLVGGKIVERWGSEDEFGLMQQLEAIPLRVPAIPTVR